MIEKSIEHVRKDEYFPMEFSKIFLSISSFNNMQNKFVTQENQNEKKIK